MESDLRMSDESPVDKKSAKLADRLNKLIDDAVAARPLTGVAKERKPIMDKAVNNSTNFKSKTLSLARTMAQTNSYPQQKTEQY